MRHVCALQKNKEYDASLQKKSGTKFVRHRSVSRANVVLYDVGVFTVKLAETENAPAATAISITLESLKRLAMVDPSTVLPDPPPSSHCGGHQQSGRRGNRAGDHTARAAPRREAVAACSEAGAAASSSTSTAPAQVRQPARKRRRMRRVVESDSSESEDSSHSSSSDSSDAQARDVQTTGSRERQIDDDDDERAQVPEGFQQIAWVEGDNIDHFMVWTAIDGQQYSWHRGKVVKALSKHTRYTHDVFLDESRQKRGIALDAKGYADGCWIAIAPHDGAASTSNDVEARRAEASASVEQTLAVTVEVSTPRRAHARRRERKPFECGKCHKSNDAFLYCPSDSPDGAPPPLCCIDCAPRGWVCVSRTDYESELVHK